MSLFPIEETPITYADVMVPLAVPNLFTYKVPEDFVPFLEIGFRVIVPFGSKITTGIVAKIHDQAPAYKTKYIDNILDGRPVVSPQQIKLMHWMADYYMCTIGEVLIATLPAGMKISSDSKIQLHPDYDPEWSGVELNEKERLLVEHLLEQPHVDFKELPEIIGIKSPSKVIKSLVEKQAIILFEQVKDKYSPKKEKYVRLKEHWAEETALQQLFGLLEKKEKQQEVIMRYLQAVNIFDQPELNEIGLSKKSLTAQEVSPSAIKTLVKNQILEEFNVEISRIGHTSKTIPDQVELTPAQQKAKAEINQGFENNQPVLLHGITGSGKTELYISMIQEALDSGVQVLLALPEIALTTQIVDRLSKYFGDQMGVYHSKYSDNERVEVWKGVVNGTIQFVVGVRSSLLLPFDHLGLIIVDECHETSFKQYDPAPRYYGADLALVLGHLHQARLVMGSATPSFEQFYLAEKGKYKLVQLTERFGQAQLPEIQLVDISRERKAKTMQGPYSSVLVKALEEALKKGEQAIIFQNRRGYAPVLICEDCGTVHQCPNCAVSLTKHQFQNELKCHYCGYKAAVPHECFACGSKDLVDQGFGTQKLEESLQQIFPEISIQRMDLDTTRNKYSYQTIIDDFEKQKIQVLIGTQMVTKGLDFEGVSLVGIVDADRMLGFPDFRSNERAYQMMTQVGGRAGRRAERKGKVIIQSRDLAQATLHTVVEQNYTGLYKNEIAEREEFHYPPFRRLIKIVVKHREERVCQQAAVYLNAVLQEWLGTHRALGAQSPAVSKIRNEYIREIIVKLERENIDLKKAKRLMQQAIIETEKQAAFKKVRIYCDVDPY
ncbi:replication restart helicase PriA [Persicobacter diffluens]|uniref:Replication restart protein PriA n=1 Tax=Persicobacter diffluens TaxID=981 RepID=A0AAN5AJK5_9BACT|nr:primosomal protein N' [Persicobacter diffluens]